ncbi:endonuclease domain-containing protein [Novosphingobium malaysiense]|uniref:endonuclease domain-containing protein n=1 Tax=Novosphingobium malaysiense TaxID=1348853 RepID=UPI001E3ABF89|nr:endonuclease domain-containing protein [Novosphingobium malaysiense]
MARPKGVTEGELPRTKTPRNTSRARQLRQQMSLPEVLLWKLLRNSPDGVKFRRQHSLAESVTVDFYCAEARLCIEIDGIAHDMGNSPDRDEQRDALLREQGLEVVRIPASDVLKSPEDVAEALVRLCKR